MRTARGARAAKTIRLVIGCLAVAALGSGCLFSRVGYKNAQRLVRWSVGDYVEFDPDQRVQLEQTLREIHRWHSQEELPIYAAIALEAARRIEGRLKPADLDWAEAVFRARYDVLMTHAARQLAPIAGTIKPAQVAAMTPKFDRSNQKFRAQYLEVTREARVKKRVDQALQAMEDWVGNLGPDQRRILAAKVAALPETAEYRYAQHLVRQKALRSLVEAQRPPDNLIEGLKLWLVGWDAGRSPEHERIYAEWMRQSKLVVLELDAMLTRKQRAHAIEKLRRHAADFAAWSKEAE